MIRTLAFFLARSTKVINLHIRIRRTNLGVGLGLFLASSVILPVTAQDREAQSNAEIRMRLRLTPENIAALGTRVATAAAVAPSDPTSGKDAVLRGPEKKTLTLESVARGDGRRIQFTLRASPRPAPSAENLHSQADASQGPSAADAPAPWIPRGNEKMLPRLDGVSKPQNEPNEPTPLGVPKVSRVSPHGPGNKTDDASVEGKSKSLAKQTQTSESPDSGKTQDAQTGPQSNSSQANSDYLKALQEAEPAPMPSEDDQLETSEERDPSRIWSLAELSEQKTESRSGAAKTSRTSPTASPNRAQESAPSVTKPVTSKLIPPTPLILDLPAASETPGTPELSEKESSDESNKRANPNLSFEPANADDVESEAEDPESAKAPKREAVSVDLLEIPMRSGWGSPAQKKAENHIPKIEQQPKQSQAVSESEPIAADVAAPKPATIAKEESLPPAPTPDAAPPAQDVGTSKMAADSLGPTISKEAITGELHERIENSEDSAEPVADIVEPSKVEARSVSSPLKNSHTTPAKRIEDAEGKECPGAPDGSETHQSLPDDLPLDQDEHPYDAPHAKSTQIPDVPEKPPAVQFTARELSIHQRINECLKYFIEHPENTTRRGPWALMHTALPYGVESEIIAGNRRVNTIGWMCFNGVCAKQRMFQPTKRGFRTNVGPGVQGHEGQFLAILAQSRVQSDYPLKIGNRTYSINDLVKYEMSTCRERSELTFKLIGLSYYLPQDQIWRDNRGVRWSLEKMVKEELAQPINGVACGGTHRLMGLSFAVIERQRKGLPIAGDFSRAERYLNDYINYTMTLQNPDGSFSTNWFEGRGNKPDVKRKVQTTGHMLEWLIYTLPDEHLRSSRIQKSIEYLLSTVGARPGYDWPIGPRGHALRALALYNQRVFGAEQGALRQYIAEQLANPMR